MKTIDSPAADLLGINPNSELYRQLQIFIFQSTSQCCSLKNCISAAALVHSDATIALTLAWLFREPVVFKSLHKKVRQVSLETFQLGLVTVLTPLYKPY